MCSFDDTSAGLAGTQTLHIQMLPAKCCLPQSSEGAELLAWLSWLNIFTPPVFISIHGTSAEGELLVIQSSPSTFPRLWFPELLRSQLGAYFPSCHSHSCVTHLSLSCAVITRVTFEGAASAFLGRAPAVSAACGRRFHIGWSHTAPLGRVWGREEVSCGWITEL